MNRHIKKVAVLGSGVMGSRIACHFAGIGVQVLLLDILPASLTEAEQTGGLTMEDAVVRNRVASDALAYVVKSNPSPIFTKDVLKKITIGNAVDNMSDIASCDWIIEVVIEKIDIKKSIYEQVERHRIPGTLITSNTSGIPIHMLSEGRSEDFKKHFCGTHFFNPPRYLRLLEIIPTADTDPSVIDFLMHYGDVYLGKTTVLCKDTPAFIANRIGVFSMMAIMHIMEKLTLSIDEVEALTGPAIGRPKSATFRTADVVGIDTLVKVAAGIAANATNDEAKAIFAIPQWLQKMVANNWLGDKTGQGFFKKIKNPDGSKDIQVLDLQSMDYVSRRKASFPSLEAAKSTEDLKSRLKILISGTDKAAEFYRQFHYYLFSYISHRVPEICDKLYQVDDAMMAGFGWEIGAFASWDTLGFVATTQAMKAAGHTVAPWVDKCIAAGNTSFYKVESGKKMYYDIASEKYKEIPGGDAFLIMKDKADNIIWKNNVCTAYDLGDDIVGLQWATKMNTFGGEVLEGIQKSIAKAEENFKGLVIANEGPNFSLGANVGMIFMYATEQEYDELDMAVRMFQNTMMRVRYSSIPVVMALHGMTLGGGCEMALHADSIQAAAETYIGLVEMGVGLIPGGGGTKEFALRAGDEYVDGEVEIEPLKRRFMTIGMAKVASSAYEAYDLGIMRSGVDDISMNINRRIADAKQKALHLWEKGYTRPLRRKDVKVLGRGALGALYAGVNAMKKGLYISEHDEKIAKKLAYVMCGGDLSESTLVSEQYLLDIEREAFLSLCGERKTLERIQSVLKGGKPIRN